MYINISIPVHFLWSSYGTSQKFNIKKKICFLMHSYKNRTPTLKFNKRVKWRKNVSHVAIYLWSLRREGEKITSSSFKHLNDIHPPKSEMQSGTWLFPDKPFQHTYSWLHFLFEIPLFFYFLPFFFLFIKCNFIFSLLISKMKKKINFWKDN